MLSGTKVVRIKSQFPESCVFNGSKDNAVQSIMGATEKRLDTVAGVFAGFKPCSMVVSGVRVSGVFPGVCGHFE